MAGKLQKPKPNPGEAIITDADNLGVFIFEIPENVKRFSIYADATWQIATGSIIITPRAHPASKSRSESLNMIIKLN